VRGPRSAVGPAALAAAVLVLGGCSGAGGTGDTLTVYAASSLTSSFDQLADTFQADHDGVTVRFNYAGSSDLVAQIQEGAPADVFASADQANMDKLSDADLTGSDPVPFASNTLEIVVPADNPAGITSMKDLEKPGVDVVVCAPEVPCGAAATRLAEAAQVKLTPVSEEQKVTDVLAKVESGEADAGLVYVTDVQGAGDAVLGIPVPQASAAVNVYPIATVAGSDHQRLAQEFVDLVLSTQGQQVLQDAGFAPPPK
jgi:molybdate transport system substrate-binding protein